jgi:two-component system C4-dicarboxylate transport sensor histidine kinase DctB
VGHKYAFRPYFREALAGRLGRFYGVGTTTGEPGYFLASPLRDGERVLGVLAVKVGLEALERALASSGEALVLADGDGVIFLASERGWRYRSLAPLPAAVRARLAETRQYHGESLEPLADRPIPLDGGTPMRLALPGEPARERLVQSRPVGGLGWQAVQLADPAEARRAALGGGLAVALGAGLVLALAAFQAHRRRRREELRRLYASLEARIAERTADLTAKVEALKSTEAILRETQDAAVQAGKLAVLGQMAAGISHELNQPLAALRTFADNAAALLARGRHAEAAENLATIGELVERAGRIVRQLKTFARKGPGEREAVGVAAAIDHALLIVEPRRRELAAVIDVAVDRPELAVAAEPVRLEQVLLNLLRNGLDAMAGAPAPRLEVGARQAGGRVEIAVADRGPGLAPEVLAHLFEPFYTTKPVGEGLGLGLAISRTILEGYGGRLEARNRPGGGAEFVITLDAVAVEDRAHDP